MEQTLKLIPAIMTFSRSLFPSRSRAFPSVVNRKKKKKVPSSFSKREQKARTTTCFLHSCLLAFLRTCRDKLTGYKNTNPGFMMNYFCINKCYIHNKELNIPHLEKNHLHLPSYLWKRIYLINTEHRLTAS